MHRVGRTARAGRSGTSYSFVTQYNVDVFKHIENNVMKKKKKKEKNDEESDEEKRKRQKKKKDEKDKSSDDYYDSDSDTDTNSDEEDNKNNRMEEYKIDKSEIELYTPSVLKAEREAILVFLFL
jgi:superfamily II DNA/RNA helicase